MTEINPSKRVFVALDTTDVAQAAALAETLREHVGGMKVGKEFFTANGPAGVARITELGMPVFLDLKFHDIPNTVAGAVRSAVALKPFMLNVHASGGAAMLRAAAETAAEAADKAGIERPLVLAVTVLTSLSNTDLAALGVSDNTDVHVLRLAELAQACGIDGVVCSPRECEALRLTCGPDFKLVVPGIRPIWAATDDQKRIMTPSDAVKHGADYLVIGRPITGADDPVLAAKTIAEELAGV